MAIEMEMVKVFCDPFHPEDEPELFKPRIKRPKGNFFSTKEVIDFLHYSPSMFVDVLRKHKDIISIYNSRLTREDFLAFYDESINSVECIYAIKNARFHYIEFRMLYDKILSESLNKNSERPFLESLEDNNFEEHGLCSLVIRMRQEGKTDEEIAEFLDSSGRSLSQIGALLHTAPEATQAAQMKLAQRLLGKA